MNAKTKSESESGYKKSLRLNTTATEFATILKIVGAKEAKDFIGTVPESEQRAVFRRALKHAQTKDQKDAMLALAAALFPAGLTKGGGEMPTSLKVSHSKGRSRPHVCLPIPDDFDVRRGDYLEVFVTKNTFGVRCSSRADLRRSPTTTDGKEKTKKSDA